ncbi:mCpol domain-containing protein [Thermococcus nautili]|uniref:Minimal CRISPR polymerase domain-containing protein n=1 Tax=Thermococcus nautili TaxID=195522 RepID=W8PKM6_9EURY|nr:mCpol domain-containing protein [Thermococcus nautili]AHL22644.1 hypothetical protein BD01_1026 [Thermococcus nautili]
MTYISIDGDNIGALLEKFILQNKKEDLKNISKTISLCFQSFISKLESEVLIPIEVIVLGGDTIIIEVNEREITTAINVIIKHFSNCPFSVSIGIGASLREAYLALKFAKATGKNKIVIHKDSKFKILAENITNHD